MADANPVSPQEDTASPQTLVGFMSNDEWDALLVHVNGVIGQMDALPDGALKSNVFDLLAGIDTIHRESLRRLVRLFKEGVLEKVVSDPAIHTLMDLYDLLPPEAPEPDAEKPRPQFPTIPIKVLRAAPSVRARYPHWLPMLQQDDQASGTIREITIEGKLMLLCRREDRFFALDGICAQDDSSMAGATLAGYTLTCPHHSGCHYDIRRGTRIGSNDAIACYPVSVEQGGRVMVGLDMDFQPDVPSF